MTANHRVFIAVGSNLAPEHRLARAVQELRKAFPDIRFSQWYRNAATGFAGDDFVNLAAGFTTELPVQELGARVRAIETLCGRSREALETPTSIDIDLLLYDDLICDESGLTLPRPELLNRAYQLGPLADIAADVVHPTAGVTIGELWRRFDKSAHPLIPIPLP